MEDWEAEENTNIDVFEKIEENCLRSFKYVEAHVNVLDEIPQSYSHQRNSKLDQIRYIAKTRNHEYVYSKVAILLSKVCAFCEEEGHAIMDYPFVPFHIKVGIIKHVELWNVAKTLMDQL
jgi:hypothetical protein